MSNTYLLKARPSHFTNTFYYLFLGAISFLLARYSQNLTDLSIFIASTLNSLVLNKDQAFVTLLSQCFFYAIVFSPLFFGAYRFIKTELNLYYFYEDRLVFYTGLANRHRDNIEYYRVKDHYLNQPFYLKLFGLQVLTILSTDRRHPNLKLKGFRHIDEFYDEFRMLVEKSRESGKGAEMDMV